MAKRKFPWQDGYAERFGLKVASRDATSSKVDAAVCCFCQTFGRETATTQAAIRKRKKTKVHQTFTKDKFSPTNIKKHMIEQHPAKWKKYITARDAKSSDPDAFESFFEQAKLEAFFFKQDDVEGKLSYSIDKDIVEVVIKDMLFDDDDGDDDSSARDNAIKAFKPVKNEAGEVISYTVTVQKKAQFDHVLELVSASLSFRQIAKVVRSDRENLGTAAKIGPVSPGEASDMARIACAIGLQALSEIMKASWAFSIGADESNSDGQDSHLDLRVQFPALVGFEGGPAVVNGFHLLAIPLFALAHSGRVYCDLLIRLLDVLCPDWRMKLIGSSTDGAGNMTGHNVGFSTLLRNESLCKEAFYRLWCIAHQLDLVTKKSVTKLDDSGVFTFMKPLTEVIAYLRRQKNLMSRMGGAKCPYYITVRWKSLAKVSKWLLANREQVSTYMQQKSFQYNPSSAW